MIEEGRISIPSGQAKERSIWDREVYQSIFDPSSTILEAQVGEDGVYRVEGETDLESEADRIRDSIKKDMEDMERFIFGKW